MTRLHEDVLAQSMIRWLHNNRELRETDPAYFKRLVKAGPNIWRWTTTQRAFAFRSSRPV